jgi:hypothetical protein
MRLSRGFFFSFKMTFFSINQFLACVTTSFAIFNLIISIMSIRISPIIHPLVEFFRSFFGSAITFFNRLFGQFYPFDMNDNLISLTVILIVLVVRYQIVRHDIEQYGNDSISKVPHFSIRSFLEMTLLITVVSSIFIFLIIGIPLIRWILITIFHVYILYFVATGFIGYRRLRDKVGVLDARESAVRKRRFAGFMAGAAFGAATFLTLNSFY